MSSATPGHGGLSSSGTSLSLIQIIHSEKVESGPDAKAFKNHIDSPPALSKAYNAFTSPIENGTRGGFDIHIYFLQTNEFETKFASELHERIRRECKNAGFSSQLHHGLS